jgi:antitoxin component of MazEF toxin-antitoxin module
MQTKVQKWGNSYAVRLPKELVTRLGLQAGSTVQVVQEGATVVVKQVSPKEPVTFKDWNKFLIPMKTGKTVHVSDRVDEILYGKTD